MTIHYNQDPLGFRQLKPPHNERFMVISATVKYCIVCDDARMEVNAKEILIGVYTSGLRVPNFPFTAILCLWFIVAWSGEGVTTVSARIIGPNGKQLWINSGSARVIPNLEEGSYTFRNVLFSVDEDGYYDIQWRVAAEDWTTVRKFIIKRISTS